MKVTKGKILLACSYGPDSMALFDMLLKRVGPEQLEVAHVNYHLRKESDSEEVGLIQFCNKHGIKYHIHNVTQNLGTSNVEEKCREIRYSFFKSVYQNGFDSLYVAHNQDDLIETYLMQKRRGNIVECYGIQKKTRAFEMNIVRPLLGYKKSDLLKYCEENKVPYAIDKTNLENKFLRNKIRHEIVEKLTNKERKEHLAIIRAKNKELNDTKKRIKELNLKDVKTLTELSDYEFAIAINMLIHKYQKDAFISKKYAEEIKKALLNGKPNLEFKINPQLYLLKEYDKLSVSAKKVTIFYEFKLEKPGKLETDYFFLDFTKDASNRNVHLEDYPITIRSAKPEDKIKIKDYYKTMRRLFIDWKVPNNLRKRWPVIVNKQGVVIYTPRYQKSFIVDKALNFYVK